jgi:hypothetical protein
VAASEELCPYSPGCPAVGLAICRQPPAVRPSAMALCSRLHSPPYLVAELGRWAVTEAPPFWLRVGCCTGCFWTFQNSLLQVTRDSVGHFPLSGPLSALPSPVFLPLSFHEVEVSLIPFTPKLHLSVCFQTPWAMTENNLCHWVMDSIPGTSRMPDAI